MWGKDAVELKNVHSINFVATLALELVLVATHFEEPFNTRIRFTLRLEPLIGITDPLGRSHGRATTAVGVVPVSRVHIELANFFA